LWEAILASIDAKAYLYAMAHGGTYNVRAFSSLIGETFFAELTLNDKSGQGTVTAKEFGVFISRSTEQLQIRLDPERFVLQMTRSSWNILKSLIVVKMYFLQIYGVLK